MRHVDVFLIVWSQVCHTSLTTLLHPVGDRFLGSGTQQAPAQCVNSEFRSHSVVQIWRRRAQASELGRDGKTESAPAHCNEFRQALPLYTGYFRVIQ